MFKRFKEKRQEKEAEKLRRKNRDEALRNQLWKADFFDANGEFLGELTRKGRRNWDSLLADYWVNGSTVLQDILELPTIRINNKIYNTAGMSMSIPEPVKEEGEI